MRSFEIPRDVKELLEMNLLSLVLAVLLLGQAVI